MAASSICPHCGTAISAADTQLQETGRCLACGRPASVATTEDTAADFQAMLEQATRDNRTTPMKVSLQQARLGRRALLAAAGLCLLANMLCLFPRWLLERGDWGGPLLWLVIGHLVASVVFLGLYRSARGDTLLPLIGGLILCGGLPLWLLAAAPPDVTAPLAVVLGPFHLALLYMLTSALRATLEYRRLRRKALMREY